METASATLLEVTVTHFTFAVFLFFILGFQTICKISVGATYQSIHSEWLIHVALVTEWRRLLFLLNHFICFKDRKQSKGYFLRTQVSNPKPQGSFCLRTIWTNWNDLYNLRLLEISSWNYKTAGSCEVSWSRLFKEGGSEKIELSPRTQYESTGCDLTSNARQNYNVALLASKRERKSLQLKAWTLRPGRAQTKSYWLWSVEFQDGPVSPAC